MLQMAIIPITDTPYTTDQTMSFKEIILHPELVLLNPGELAKQLNDEDFDTENNWVFALNLKTRTILNDTLEEPI